MLQSIPTPHIASDSSAKAAPASDLAHQEASSFGVALNQVSRSLVAAETQESLEPIGNVLPQDGAELPELTESLAELGTELQIAADYDVKIAVNVADGRLIESPGLNVAVPKTQTMNGLDVTAEDPGKLATLAEWGHRIIQDSAAPASVLGPAADSRSPTTLAVPHSNLVPPTSLAREQFLGSGVVTSTAHESDLVTNSERQHAQLLQTNELQTRIPGLAVNENLAGAERDLKIDAIGINSFERGEISQKNESQLMTSSSVSTIATQSNVRENLLTGRIAPPLTTTIDRPVLDKAWGADLQEKVLWMTNRHIQNAEIRLNPAELGPIRIQVSVEDEAATVMFTAQHNVTREAIELALPRLREMLSDHGLSLAGSTVTDSDDGELQKESRTRDNDASTSDESSSRGEDSDEKRHRRAVNASALVDTFA